MEDSGAKEVTMKLGEEVEKYIRAVGVAPDYRPSVGKPPEFVDISRATERGEERILAPVVERTATKKGGPGTITEKFVVFPDGKLRLIQEHSINGQWFVSGSEDKTMDWSRAVPIMLTDSEKSGDPNKTPLFHAMQRRTYGVRAYALGVERALKFQSDNRRGTFKAERDLI